MIARKARKKISSQVKAQILEEMTVPDCVVTDLIKTYGISRTTLYKWRKQLKPSVKQAGSVIDSNFFASSGFIEMSVEDKNVEVKMNAGAKLKVCDLQKASLIFSDFSLSIEGKINNARLIEILSILED